MGKVNVISAITEKQINKVIEQRQQGLFWTIDSKTGKFKAVKNLKSKTSINNFDKLSDCVDWLKGEVS